LADVFPTSAAELATLCPGNRQRPPCSSDSEGYPSRVLCLSLVCCLHFAHRSTENARWDSMIPRFARFISNLPTRIPARQKVFDHGASRFCTLDIKRFVLAVKLDLARQPVATAVVAVWGAALCSTPPRGVLASSVGRRGVCYERGVGLWSAQELETIRSYIEGKQYRCRSHRSSPAP